MPKSTLLILDAKKSTLDKFWLSERQAPAYSLRVKSQTHNKALTDKAADLNERNFLIRVYIKTATDF